MIALDTSTLIAYLEGERGPDVEIADAALAGETAVLPPAVLTEVLSDPSLRPEIIGLVLQVQLLELEHGYWERAGTLRRKILGQGNKAKLADSLIAQACIDRGVPLVSRDRDYRHFTREGLELLPVS